MVVALCRLRSGQRLQCGTLVPAGAAPARPVERGGEDRGDLEADGDSPGRHTVILPRMTDKHRRTTATTSRFIADRSAGPGKGSVCKRSRGCPPGGGRASELLRNAGAVRRLLGVSDSLVGEVGDVAIDGLGVEEAQGFLVAGLAEEALACPEHDREDFQPQLVDKVVL